MEDHGLLNPPARSTVLKTLVAGALTGGLLTLLTRSADCIAANHGSRFLGVDMLVPIGIVFGPSGKLIEALGLPIRYWGPEFPGITRTGILFATLFNALVLAVIATLLGWFWSKVRKQQFD